MYLSISQAQSSVRAVTENAERRERILNLPAIVSSYFSMVSSSDVHQKTEDPSFERLFLLFSSVLPGSSFCAYPVFSYLFFDFFVANGIINHDSFQNTHSSRTVSVSDVVILAGHGWGEFP